MATTQQSTVATGTTYGFVGRGIDVDPAGYEVSPAAYVDVRTNGADPTGVADSTAAIQKTINGLPTAGGAVYFPTGTYRISDVLTLRSNLLLVGDGDGPSLIRQYGANKDAMSGTALNKITVQGLYFVGTGAGTGSGLNLAKGANDAVPYICVRDVTFESFGQDAVAIENPIVTVLERVIAQSNGRYGFNIFGQAGGAAATSTALLACYGNGNGTAGFRLLNLVYGSLSGCAADHNPIGYFLDGCQGVTLQGVGAEGNATVGLKINGGYGNTAAGCWVYDNRGIGAYVTGSANTVSLIAATDNTPNASATNFIKVDSGSHVTLMSCSNTTANSLASGTTNVASDAAGGGQFQGYAALIGGGEFDADLTCFTSSKGIVLSDRSNGNRYRLKVTAGVLGVEVAP